MIDIVKLSSLYLQVIIHNHKIEYMEWILEDGNVSEQVQTSEDIATIVRSMMDGKSEFVILSPSIPVKTCNFMQAAPVDTEDIHFEVSLLQPTGKNRTYSKVCTPDVAIRMFTMFFTENIVPDVIDWKFEGEFG